MSAADGKDDDQGKLREVITEEQSGKAVKAISDILETGFSQKTCQSISRLAALGLNPDQINHILKELKEFQQNKLLDTVQESSTVTRLLFSCTTCGRLPGSDASAARTSLKLFVWLDKKGSSCCCCCCCCGATAQFLHVERYALETILTRRTNRIILHLPINNFKYIRMSRLRVKFKHFTAVAAWKWDAADDICGMCRNAFDGCCGECWMPGEECPLVWGECGHCFHMHCILKWLQPPNSSTSNQQCPMCRAQWKFKEKDNSVDEEEDENGEGMVDGDDEGRENQQQARRKVVTVETAVVTADNGTSTTRMTAVLPSSDAAAADVIGESPTYDFRRQQEGNNTNNVNVNASSGSTNPTTTAATTTTDTTNERYSLPAVPWIDSESPAGFIDGGNDGRSSVDDNSGAAAAAAAAGSAAGLPGRLLRRGMVDDSSSISRVGAGGGGGSRVGMMRGRRQPAAAAVGAEEAVVDSSSLIIDQHEHHQQTSSSSFSVLLNMTPSLQETGGASGEVQAASSSNPNQTSTADPNHPVNHGGGGSLSPSAYLTPDNAARPPLPPF